MTNEEKIALRKHKSSMLNEVYKTKSGREFLIEIVKFCQYWTPAHAKIAQGFKPEQIQMLDDVVKYCIFAHLDSDSLAELIKTAKGE